MNGNGQVTGVDFETCAKKACWEVRKRGLSVTWIAEVVGRSRGQVSNTLNATKRANGELMGSWETLGLVEQVLRLVETGRLVPPARGYVRGRMQMRRVRV